jgi:hypothetical protein
MDDLPPWFVEKWSKHVSFCELTEYWCSRVEYKKESTMSEFAGDAQKALFQDLDYDGDLQLLWFADEGASGGTPFYITLVTRESIGETTLTPTKSIGLD